MSQLFLVRHGQASFGAANYDQLSALGYQQSAWLGEHFAELGIQFSRIVTGTLARQQQTAASILETSGQYASTMFWWSAPVGPWRWRSVRFSIAAWKP